MRKETYKEAHEKWLTKQEQRKREVIANSISERSFQDQVIEAAQIFGWKVYHTWNAIHSSPGFPDLVLCKPPYLIMAELKKENGTTKPAQDEWLETLKQCQGVQVFVWRPSDLSKITDMLGNSIEKGT